MSTMPSTVEVPSVLGEAKVTTVLSVTDLNLPILYGLTDVVILLYLSRERTAPLRWQQALEFSVPEPAKPVIRQVRCPEIADVEQAWHRIESVLEPTPVVAAPAHFVLKLESLQPTGSFKVRGALNAVASLDDAQVVTASAGNHGLGVAFAARRLGRQATIVIPETASTAKASALRRFPVRLVRTGRTYDDAENHAIGLCAASTGTVYVSAYNDTSVIAGQGTIGRELSAQIPGPLTIVCPIGGGGLAAGLGIWAAHHDDVIVGVEASASPAVSSAIRGTGPPVVRETIADGLAGNLEPGSVTVEMTRRYVGAIATVTEPQIRHAIRYLATELGIIAEGSGAVAVAAVLAGQVPSAPGRIVALVTGRNIASSLLAEILR
jgi:threonine dehydratase